MRAEKERWNATDNTQRKRLIQTLQELIDQLKKENGRNLSDQIKYKGSPLEEKEGKQVA